MATILSELRDAAGQVILFVDEVHEMFGGGAFDEAMAEVKLALSRGELALIGATTLIKYMWPMKRMRAADVRTRSLVAGGVLGVIGFFVIPVVGLLIGFVLGIYLAELINRRNQRVAWTSTKHALKGVALSVGVELAGALLATVAWVAGVYLTQ